MAIVKTDDAHYKNIGAKIREKTGTATTYKPSEMPSGVDEVYEAGKKAGYDAFWDAYQDYGNRRDYSFAFGGIGWTAETLKPKYHLVPVNAILMFRSLSLGVNLTDFFEAQGINLDFSKTTSFTEAFLNSNITGLGTVDTRAANHINNIFINAKFLQEIRLLILKEGGSQLFNRSFEQCVSLVDLTVQGAIGQNGFDVHWSDMLSKDSITSIVNALSTTTTGLTVTLSLASVTRAFATAEGEKDGELSAEWLALVATRSNWTISLA